MNKTKNYAMSCRVSDYPR